MVSHLGGSGAVFRKLGANRYQSQIKAKVHGKIRPDQQYRIRQRTQGTSEDSRTLFFQYAFTIQLSDDRESVFFARQSIRFQKSDDHDADPKKIKEWEADLQISGNADGSVTCHRATLESHYREELLPRAQLELSLEQNVEQKCSSDASLIFLAYSMLPGEYGIPFLNEFRGGIIFNPHPSRIRLPEDSAKTPGIRADGSGLYASLFAIKRGRPKTDSGPRRFWFRSQELPFVFSIKLERLLEFFKLAYPSMANLTVTNDQFENTIRVRITLDNAAKSQIPLATLSDGTLKWMAFVTAIFTNSNILAIEEPENFVHPFVQREAIKVVRNQLEGDAYMFMSSHSETILNAAEPEEVIVVSSRRSRTVARRVRNPKHLRELISQSGFGLGFYYLSGVLEDA